jgi:hypothetical protein
VPRSSVSSAFARCPATVHSSTAEPSTVVSGSPRARSATLAASHFEQGFQAYRVDVLTWSPGGQVARPFQEFLDSFTPGPDRGRFA